MLGQEVEIVTPNAEIVKTEAKIAETGAELDWLIHFNKSKLNLLPFSREFSNVFFF